MAETTAGMYQVVSRQVVYFARMVVMDEKGATLQGPKIITMSFVEQGNKTHGVRNIDNVISRFVPWQNIVCIDALDVTALDKTGKEYYEALSGVAI